VDTQHAESVEAVRVYARIRDVPVALDRVLLYVPASVGELLLADIAAVKPGELWVNPGAESDALLLTARSLGLDPILACAIVDIGQSPARFPD
jgi:hypothetical protein